MSTFAKWKREFQYFLYFTNPVMMLFLTLIVGILAGIGSLLFRGLIAVFHNLFFYGRLNFIYTDTYHTSTSIWGIGIIFIPMIGGLAVIWLINTFANEERGLSVPEIMYKMHSKNAKVKPSVALVKTLASSISISSGASIGREGPVMHIGASIGSVLCSIFNLSMEHRRALVAMGIASSTAALFNAPMAGIVFALELFVVSYNVFTVLMIIFAASTACYINNLIMGSAPIFSVEGVLYLHGFIPIIIALILFTLLGILIGVLSVLLIRGVYWTQDVCALLIKSSYARHLIAMFLVGVMFYLFMLFYGHYYIDGVGFSTIQDCLNYALTDPWLLLLLCIAKLIATCLSLGSGSSGGIFSPAMFLGATLGCLFGVLVNYFAPTLGIPATLFTLAGLGGMVSSATGAAITAILFTYEISHNTYAIVPVIISCTVAYYIRMKICSESIYTLKLVREGRDGWERLLEALFLMPYNYLLNQCFYLML